MAKSDLTEKQIKEFRNKQKKIAESKPKEPQSINQSIPKQMLKKRQDRFKFTGNDNPENRVKKKVIIERVPLTRENFKYTLERNWAKLTMEGKGIKPILFEENIETYQEIIDTVLEGKKGIFLSGINRIGKSTLIRALVQTVNSAHKLGYLYPIPRTVDYNDLKIKISEDGNIGRLSKLRGNIFLDDLGYDNKSNMTLWGNKENLITSILYQFEKSFATKGSKYFITSNLTVRDIREMCGVGTHGRLLDICNCYVWKGKNLSAELY